MSATLSEDHSPVTAEESNSNSGPPPPNGGGPAPKKGLGTSSSSTVAGPSTMAPRGGGGDGDSALSNGGPDFDPPTGSGDGDNGGTSSHHEHASNNGKADLSSSDDVDVTTTSDSPEKRALMADHHNRALAASASGSSSSSSTHPPPVTPEPNIRERLRRVRLHVVNPLFKHSKSSAFREPVNAKALGIYPIYHQIIKRPMDLGTVRKKIDRGEYLTRAQCLDDIGLIWENAKTFNKPGHFVHENAKVLEAVTRDKLARLERDEAAGVFDQPKAPLKGRVGAPEITVRPRDEPRPERRASRKVSADFLPGESAQPQQLKKKYVENLDEQMRQCDSILKELLTARLHQAYVEPFLQSPGEALDLYKVQQRLQAGYYRHPLQFASDFRGIISRAYRLASSDPKDPILAHASDLQHNFEVLFCRVEYEPVANPAFYDGGGGVLGGLLTAQTQITAIQANVADLLSDLVVLRQQDVSKRGRKPRPGPSRLPSAAARGLNRAGATTSSKPRKRGRPPGQAAAAGQQGAGNKRPRKRKTGAPPEAAAFAATSSLTEEQRLALRAEIAGLKEDQQTQIVQIMMTNGETLSQDANGYTEIDLGNCSARTIKLIQDYVKKVSRGPAVATSATGPSPPKKKRQKREESSESESSDSSEEEDSSSSSSSDESDSD